MTFLSFGLKSKADTMIWRNALQVWQLRKSNCSAASLASARSGKLNVKGSSSGLSLGAASVKD